MKTFCVLKYLISISIALLSITTSSCSAREKTKTAVNKAEPVKSEFISSNDITPSRYISPIFSNVKADKNILYKSAKNESGQSENLELDVYQPEGDSQSKRPAIIWAHGGGFCSGSKDAGIEMILAQALAKKGYVSVCINYRLRNNPSDDWEGTLNDAGDDAVDAYKWVVKNSQKYGIDTDHIAIGGHSAGGTLAINLCYDSIGKEQLPDNSFFCVIDLAGGMLHTSKTRETSTPCIIIGGTDDETVPYSWSESLSGQLNENNIDNILHGVKGAPHDLCDYEDEVENVITKYLYKYLTGTEPDVK